MLTIETLREKLEPFGGVLRSGAHEDMSSACIWEAINYAKGNAWGDQCPECVAPDVHGLLIRLNDSRCWRDDVERTDVLLPAGLRALGTAGDVEAMQLRVYRLADVAVRVIAADAMESAGLPDEAAKLRALAPITDVASAEEGRKVARAAADAAAAAADAYAAYADADAASAQHQRWRRHVNLLLVAAGLADEED